MAQDIIELRTGQFSALFISINSSSLTVIKRALAKKSKTSPSLFKNIEVILQFNPMLEKVNLIALNSFLPLTSLFLAILITSLKSFRNHAIYPQKLCLIMLSINRLFMRKTVI